MRGGGTQSRRVTITDADVKALQDKDNAPDVAEVVPTVNASNATVVYNGATDTPSTVSGTTDELQLGAQLPGGVGHDGSRSSSTTAHANVVVLGLTDVKNLLGAAGRRVRARRADRC